MLDDASFDHMAAALADVDGVRAVVLGGSRARGTHTATSDFDLGVYYDAGLDTGALAELAAETSNGPVELAGPGAWGPWVDGGAWVTVRGDRVDWILRRTGRVQEQCGRALRGEYAFHAQPGHPLGFLDVSYAGEVALCRPLADPDGFVAGLKATLDPYPDPLRRAFADGLWHADFLLDGAEKAVPRSDAAFVALCCAAAAMVCAHAWHAAAGVWVLNEKDLVPAVGRLPLDAGPFVDLVNGALSSLGPADDALSTAIGLARRAVRHTVGQLR